MLTTIFLGFTSVLFAYLARYKNIQWGLKVSFTLIFLFLALRYNFGNDYGGYVDSFNSIRAYDNRYLYEFLLQYEPGWILINWLFQIPGFFAMTAVLALLNSIVYYSFIKNYVPIKYYWLAVFIYIFYPDFMLVHASAMRQSIAIMIFVFSIKYLYKKEVVRYVLCIGLASLFHYTAVILLPVYLLAFFNQRARLRNGVVVISTFWALFVFGQQLAPDLKLLISLFYEKYDYYQDAGVVNSGLGFIYFSVLLIFILFYERSQNRDVAIAFKVAVVGFMFMPLTLIIEMISRLGMYFLPATIIVYPNILRNMKRPAVKAGFAVLILSVTTYQFFQFFYSDTYREYYESYKTIFSATQLY